MKLQLFSKMTARPRSRKVVRASARAMRGGEEEYYDEAEPNMKLSHAFMVVLILHVVAVGGIWAFNNLHSTKSASLTSNLTERIAKVAGSTVVKPAAPALAVQRQPGDADEPLPAVDGEQISAQPSFRTEELPATPVIAAPKTATATKPAAATKAAEPKVESKAPAPAVEQKARATAAKRESSVGPGTYAVAKGDNPYTIAKKLGITYKALLEANTIPDPTKLQIGQLLKVPAKSQ